MLENALEHHDGHLAVVGNLPDFPHRALSIIHLSDTGWELLQDILFPLELGLGPEGITDKTAKQ
jgi:hypothetical protein